MPLSTCLLVVSGDNEHSKKVVLMMIHPYDACLSSALLRKGRDASLAYRIELHNDMKLFSGVMQQAATLLCQHIFSFHHDPH